MNLLRQAMPTEKRQVENIGHQIAVVRSASLGAREKEAAYRQQLLPLIHQEEDIERERQAAHLEDKIKNVPKEGR